MNFILVLKQWILFKIYQYDLQNKKILSSLIIGTIILLLIIYFFALRQLQLREAFVPQPPTGTTLISQQENDIKNISSSIKNATPLPQPTATPFISIPPSPTPQIDPEEVTLRKAIASINTRISLLSDTSMQPYFFEQASKAASLLNEGNITDAKNQIIFLIYRVDFAEIPTPTLTQTPSPTPTPAYNPDGTSYTVKTIATERGNFSAKILTIDLNTTRMLTVSANENDCSHDCPTKSLANYVSENGAFAGVNGTYFCPPDYTECASKKNSYDFPFYNSRIRKWINSYNLLWNDRGVIFQNDTGLQFRKTTTAVREYESHYEGDVLTGHYVRKYYTFYAGFAMAPGLLDDGSVIVNQYPLTDKQRAKNAKLGLGFQDNTVYVVLAYNVSMEDLAYVFKALNAKYALNLDSGGSTALWYNGYKAGPGRSLPNAIVFVRK